MTPALDKKMGYDAGMIGKSSFIKIGKKAWLGTRTTILKGSEIADGCIIAAILNQKSNYCW